MSRRARCITPLAVLSLLALAACTVQSQMPTRHCLPPLPTVSSPTVAAGGTIELTGAPTSCDLEYDADHMYSVDLAFIGRADPVTIAIQIPVTPDGSFTALLHVPERASVGDAWLQVNGSTYDDCPNWGSSASGSCASYGVGVEIERSTPAPISAVISLVASIRSMMMAKYDGVLDLTPEGCFAIRHDFSPEQLDIIVFPFGSVVDVAAQSVTIPGWGTIAVGDRIDDGGGQIPSEDRGASLNVATRCEADQYTVVNFQR